MRTTRVLSLTLVGLSALVCPEFVRAEPSSAEIKMARDLFAQAERDEAAGSWGSALEKLTRVIAVKDTAGIRFHVATCEENMGRLRAAQDDYLAAQKHAEAEHNKEVLAAVVDPLAALHARIPQVHVVVPADVTQVEVKIDSLVASAEELAAGITLDPGAHRVEAHAAGRQAFEQTLTLAERDVTTVTVVLPREAPPPDRVAPAPAAQRETGSSGGHHASRTGAILATGGAVVLAAGGVGAFLLAGSAQSDGRAACATGASDCSGDKTKVRAWDATALGAWIGAVGLGGLATYLWLRPASDDAGSRAALRDPRRGAAHVTVGPGSVHVVGSF